MNRYTKNVSFVEIDQPTPFVEEEPDTVLWLRLTCASVGQKVKIRDAPSVSATCLGMLSDGDEVEVYEALQSGFFKLSNRPVSSIQAWFIHSFSCSFLLFAIFLDSS